MHDESDNMYLYCLHTCTQGSGEADNISERYPYPGMSKTRTPFSTRSLGDFRGLWKFGLRIVVR